jgi:hypothetical protein
MAMFVVGFFAGIVATLMVGKILHDRGGMDE